MIGYIVPVYLSGTILAFIVVMIVIYPIGPDSRVTTIPLFWPIFLAIFAAKMVWRLLAWLVADVKRTVRGGE